MLFMVVERFRDVRPGQVPRAVRDRFRARGRLIPDGSPVAYVASWMSSDGTSCYQLMDAPDRNALDPWIAQWADLVEFDVVPVEASSDYWARADAPPPG